MPSSRRLANSPKTICGTRFHPISSEKNFCQWPKEIYETEIGPDNRESEFKKINNIKNRQAKGTEQESGEEPLSSLRSLVPG